MGLKSSLSLVTFMMQLVMVAIPGSLLSTYLDDVTVHAKSYVQSLAVIPELFESLRAANIRLKPSKAEFL